MSAFAFEISSKRANKNLKANLRNFGLSVDRVRYGSLSQEQRTVATRHQADAQRETYRALAL